MTAEHDELQAECDAVIAERFSNTLQEDDEWIAALTALIDKAKLIGARDALRKAIVSTSLSRIHQHLAEVEQQLKGDA